MTRFWHFSETSFPENYKFNEVLEKFYRNGISGLVRENIQNSLDGKLPDSEGPVRVTIKTGKLPTEQIPGMREISAHIHALVGRNEYTIETIDSIKEVLRTESKMTHYISFEDENTKGLTGAVYGQNNDPKNTWSVYAYNKGVHAIDQDASMEKRRGGSHGVGKIASNAASGLNMMFFANCDEDGQQHLGGTIELIEHQLNGANYRSTGFFTDVKNGHFIPFANNFSQVFQKHTRGLKIIIPFFREAFDREEEIIKSICDSFFMAILEKKLVVCLNGHTLDAGSVERYIKNLDYYSQDFTREKKVFTPLYLDTYTNCRREILEVSSPLGSDCRFHLYFNYNESLVAGRVGIIRSVGMKIEDRKIKNHATKPYNALLIPASLESDVLLKSLEDESHTSLDPSHIKDAKLKREYSRFLNKLEQKIIQKIQDAFIEQNPTDGKMDVKDILNDVRYQFKSDLKKAFPTVKVKLKENDETLVKISTAPHPGNASGKSSRGQRPRKTKNSGVKPANRNFGEGNDSDESKQLFAIHPENVRRLLIKDTEFLRFDLSHTTQLKKASACDLKLAVIDGRGVEHFKEFDTHRNYLEIMDNSTGRLLKGKANLVKDVTLKNGIIDLKLKTADIFNPALKLVYYIEVNV